MSPRRRCVLRSSRRNTRSCAPEPPSARAPARANIPPHRSDSGVWRRNITLMTSNTIVFRGGGTFFLFRRDKVAELTRDHEHKTLGGVLFLPTFPYELSDGSRTLDISSYLMQCNNTPNSQIGRTVGWPNWAERVVGLLVRVCISPRLDGRISSLRWMPSLAQTPRDPPPATLPLAPTTRLCYERVPRAPYRSPLADAQKTGLSCGRCGNPSQ